MISPTLCTKLALRLSNMEKLQQKEHVVQGDRVERVWSYRANVRVPEFAKAYVMPEMMAWDERSLYDIKKHASEWTILPRVKPEWRKFFDANGTYELTALVHGEEEAKKAENAAKALFGAGGDSANMPTTVLADADFENGGINILSLLVATGLCPSRGEARRLVQQGGIVVDEKKVESIDESIPQEKLAGDGIIIRKGKKVFHKAVTR